MPRTWPATTSWTEGAQTSGSLCTDPGDLRLLGCHSVPGPPAPHVSHPIPCFSGGRPSPLWHSAPMATPGGPILLASSSPRHWECGHWSHPQHPTMEQCVVGCYCSPRPQKPVFPTQKAPGLPRGPEAPWPSSLTRPPSHPKIRCGCRMSCCRPSLPG